MHYWNRSSFEGLSQLAQALDESPRLARLAQYCRLRGLGLRRQAFETLRELLRQSKSWETGFAREVCQHILELSALTPEAHQFLAQPLRADLILPTLETWLAEEPSSQTPMRWLGLLRCDRDLLTRALALSPVDVPVRRALINSYLAHVDYATHHLDEGYFLDDLEATKSSLAKAQALAEGSPAPRLLADLFEEIVHSRALIEDWEAYSAASTGTFPDWCKAHGRGYRWMTRTYYGT